MEKMRKSYLSQFAMMILITPGGSIKMLLASLIRYACTVCPCTYVCTGCACMYVQDVHVRMYRMCMYVCTGCACTYVQDVCLRMYRMCVYVCTGCACTYVQDVRVRMYRMCMYVCTGCVYGLYIKIFKHTRSVQIVYTFATGSPYIVFIWNNKQYVQ